MRTPVMGMPGLHVVTGAFGYSGRYIARRLLRSGAEVRTLTNSPRRRNLDAGRIRAVPYHFDDPARLVDSLRGAAILYNTYWVRFNHPTFTHATAVDNTLKLFRAAREAGVRRIVHVSITNPCEDSPLEYFRGKAQLERALRESGISFAILRPAVLFGEDDILINNIAWVLRSLPIFGVFGDGAYRLRPIHVDDLAGVAVEQGRGSDDRIIDAVGPEAFSYRELVACLGGIIGYSRPIVSVPPSVGYAVGAVLGRILGDVVITREEIEGLMAGLLYVDSPSTGAVRLTDWAREHAETLGTRYASELARRRQSHLVVHKVPA